ncbi:methylaspartate mutase [Micromonospora sp. NPDC051227]|uniref:methylaspartate mutase n=1 Tax=Micromonospora sp. NPDC051227 TaxID=3364285 RepID=UPI0037A716A7
MLRNSDYHDGDRSAAGSFGAFVANARDAGQLVVQPRMGFQDPRRMRRGLLATKAARCVSVGTITIDSYTRVGDLAAAREAVQFNHDLNGYPIVAHPARTTCAVLDGVSDETFPVQVRHGSAEPQEIVAAMLRCQLTATEGGPVSYCLPYSRLSIRQSVRNWSRACRMLSEAAEETDIAHNARPHLETFGGCMLGQLCPPDLLLAISVLEGMFFRQHGLQSISLSYAQQTHPDQDDEAVRALRRLAAELLPAVDWHIVVYAYMGLFPRTSVGAGKLLDSAARLAVRTGSERLIVKTRSEAHRIPTAEENVDALERAAAVAAIEACGGRPKAVRGGTARIATKAETGIYDCARGLIEAVRGLDDDLGQALVRAFQLGILDVPFCLHPDNARRSRSYLDADGRLQWSNVGAMPIPTDRQARAEYDLSSSDLLAALSYVQRTFDR